MAHRHTLSELARASSGGLVSVKQAAKVWAITSHDAAVRLGRLSRAGWLARAQRGLYLVLPLEHSADAEPVVDDAWLLAQKLFAPCYIGGWTAAQHWGLTEQLFRSTFVVTAAGRRSQREVKLSTEFHLVRVGAARLKGTTTIWRGAERVAVSDRERTIADALVHPSWVGGVRHLVEILGAYRDSKDFDPRKLCKRVDELGVGAAQKRLGYLMESLWPEEEAIIAHTLARRSAGTIQLDPSLESRGRMVKRWGLWVSGTIRREAA